MDKDIIKKVAATARIQLTEEELEELSEDMENILKHFAEIKNIRSDEEMYYVYDSENPLRKDEEGKAENPDGIRDQFSKKEGKHLSAPKAIK